MSAEPDHEAAAFLRLMEAEIANATIKPGIIIEGPWVWRPQ